MKKLSVCGTACWDKHQFHAKTKVTTETILKLLLLNKSEKNATFTLLCLTVLHDNLGKFASLLVMKALQDKGWVLSTQDS